MDLVISEGGNGGDLVFDNGDVQVRSEAYNQPYLAHFGGNTGAISSDYVEGQQRLDWWGNDFLPEKEQFNSLFEGTLSKTELSSAGRIKLENAAKADLSFLEGFADTTSQVSIAGADRVELTETLIEGENKGFMYIWNEAKDEVI